MNEPTWDKETWNKINDDIQLAESASKYKETLKLIEKYIKSLGADKFPEDAIKNIIKASESDGVKGFAEGADIALLKKAQDSYDDYRSEGKFNRGAFSEVWKQFKDWLKKVFKTGKTSKARALEELTDLVNSAKDLRNPLDRQINKDHILARQREAESNEGKDWKLLSNQELESIRDAAAKAIGRKSIGSGATADQIKQPTGPLNENGEKADFEWNITDEGDIIRGRFGPDGKPILFLHTVDPKTGKVNYDIQETEEQAIDISVARGEIDD